MRCGWPTPEPYLISQGRWTNAASMRHTGWSIGFSVAVSALKCRRPPVLSGRSGTHQGCRVVFDLEWLISIDARAQFRERFVRGEGFC